MTVSPPNPSITRKRFSYEQKFKIVKEHLTTKTPISHLREQYLEEVGRGGRKPWPKSIQSRIIELCRSGIGAGKLSELTMKYLSFGFALAQGGRAGESKAWQERWIPCCNGHRSSYN